MSIKDFYCVFVRTEINLIAFSGPRNCVNKQYAALSGAMCLEILKIMMLYLVFYHQDKLKSETLQKRRTEASNIRPIKSWKNFLRCDESNS